MNKLAFLEGYMSKEAGTPDFTVDNKKSTDKVRHDYLKQEAFLSGPPPKELGLGRAKPFTYKGNTQLVRGYKGGPISPKSRAWLDATRDNAYYNRSTGEGKNAASRNNMKKEDRMLELQMEQRKLNDSRGGFADTIASIGAGYPSEYSVDADANYRKALDALNKKYPVTEKPVPGEKYARIIKPNKKYAAAYNKLNNLRSEQIKLNRNRSGLADWISDIGR